MIRKDFILTTNERECAEGLLETYQSMISDLSESIRQDVIAAFPEANLTIINAIVEYILVHGSKTNINSPT